MSTEDEIIWEGKRFKSYRYTRFNIEEHSEVTRQGEQLIFKQNWKGEHRTQAEPYTSNFVIGPLVLSYIQEHWIELKNGKELPIRYGVPDHLRTYGFNLKIDPMPDAFGQVITMRASSFFIRFFIDPISFKFSPDGKTLHAITGRALPVTAEGNKPRPIDSEMVFNPQ